MVRPTRSWLFSLLEAACHSVSPDLAVWRRDSSRLHAVSASLSSPVGDRGARSASWWPSIETSSIVTLARNENDRDHEHGRKGADLFVA